MFHHNSIIPWGSFRGQFGDHFRVGDHFVVGIISGAVQIAFQVGTKSYPIVMQDAWYSEKAEEIQGCADNHDTKHIFDA